MTYPEQSFPTENLYVSASELVPLDEFPQWIKEKENLTCWLEYPHSPNDDAIMMQHIDLIFASPQEFTAETIFRVTLRGGRLEERNSHGQATQRIYEMYKKGFDAINSSEDKDPVLIDSLALLLQEQDIFEKQQHPVYSKELQESNIASITFTKEKRKLEQILNSSENYSPEEILETISRYTILQIRTSPPENMPMRILHAYRKGLSALAGCSIKNRNFIHGVSKLFSSQSILVQQIALIPEGKVNENGYQTRPTKSGYEKPQKPKTVRLESFQNYEAHKDDRVTVAVFKRSAEQENVELSLSDKILVLQRHPKPNLEFEEDWYGYLWEVVGGGITKLPTPQATALFELQQETGLQDLPLKEYKVIPSENDPRNRNNWIYYTIISGDAPIVTSIEHIQYRWITIEEALSRSLARDHEAIFRQMCLDLGNAELKDYIRLQEKQEDK